MTGMYGIGPVAVLPDGRVLTLQTQEDSAPVAWHCDDGGASWQRSVMVPA